MARLLRRHLALKGERRFEHARARAHTHTHLLHLALEGARGLKGVLSEPSLTYDAPTVTACHVMLSLDLPHKMSKSCYSST